MIREALGSLARNESLGAALNRTPVARDVVKRLVAGESVDDAIRVADALVDAGRTVCLERAAATATSDHDADGLVEEYVDLVARLRDAGLADSCEVALVSPAFGAEPAAGDRIAQVAAAARSAGVAVMLGLGDPSELPAALDRATDLRAAGVDVGVTVPALLRGAEAECARLADSRVRLVKGGHPGDTAGVYRQPAEIDKSFVRCAKALLRGSGDISFATHDPRLVALIEDLALRFDRSRDSFEFAFYMGRSESTQARLADGGYRVRVYVPYGPDWFERLVGGLAEQPTSVAAALRSLLPGGSTSTREGR